MINGPEAFTPDNEFILGESEVRGFFVAAGFCAHGIAGTGGIGQQMAHWIVEGEPELDLWKMDIRRFGAAVPVAVAHARAERRELRDLLRHPLPERGAARGPAAAAHRRRTRTSPASGAVFGEKSMWERPNWFTPNADARGRSARAALEALRPRGWAGQHWSPAIGAEALATRQAAAIFDEIELRQDRDRGARRARLPPGLCAERHRQAGRLDHVHADAQPPRRDRVRLHGHAARAGAIPASSPARRSATTTSAGSARQPRRTDGSRAGPRRHVGAGVLRDLGAAGARHPASR